MAKRILVPLDGTGHAEAGARLVGDLARASGGTVRLLHVRPIPQTLTGDYGRVIAYASQEMDRLEAEGRGYLAGVEALLDGVPVEHAVRFGEPVEEILNEADAFGADLIAVTTRARSWLARGLRGRVAERVFGKADVPVMLLGAR